MRIAILLSLILFMQEPTHKAVLRTGTHKKTIDLWCVYSKYIQKLFFFYFSTCVFGLVFLGVYSARTNKNKNNNKNEKNKIYTIV